MSTPPTRSARIGGWRTGTAAGTWTRVDQFADDLEITDVLGQQRHPVDVRGCRDRQVHGPLAGLSATRAYRGGKSPPLARDLGGDRQRIKRRLDHPEPLRAQGPLVGVGR